MWEGCTFPVQGRKERERGGGGGGAGGGEKRAGFGAEPHQKTTCLFPFHTPQLL